MWNSFADELVKIGESTTAQDVGTALTGAGAISLGATGAYHGLLHAGRKSISADDPKAVLEATGNMLKRHGVHNIAVKIAPRDIPTSYYEHSFNPAERNLIVTVPSLPTALHEAGHAVHFSEGGLTTRLPLFLRDKHIPTLAGSRST